METELLKFLIRG